MQSVEEIPLVEKKEIIFTIEHAIGGRDFVHRSTIHLIKKPDGKQGLLFPEKNGVFGEDIQVIREMLEKNELYTIRIKSHAGNVSSEPVITSLPIVRHDQITPITPNGSTHILIPLSSHPSLIPSLSNKVRAAEVRLQRGHPGLPGQRENHPRSLLLLPRRHHF
jgi:hypothetical protein